MVVPHSENGFRNLLSWANTCSHFLWLKGGGWGNRIKGFGADQIIAFGARNVFRPRKSAFSELPFFLDENKKWAFGHFGYDLKNGLEQLASNHPDPIGFPDIEFFVPEYVVFIKGGEWEVVFQAGNGGDSRKQFLQAIEAPATSENNLFRPSPDISFEATLTKDEYLEKLELLKHHIQLGDIYEVNFCQEFHAEDIEASPLQVFLSLTEHSPNPFAAYYKIGDKYMMCASPERYLCHSQKTLVSQPIKGTSPRGKTLEEDMAFRHALQNSEKDRRENVMITDLVRNDLSKCAEPGSVKVEELYGIYTYPQVHQMISTVTATLSEGVHPVNAIRASFPMGSMTGAPKVRAMQLIEAYEVVKRGLFSGSVGFFSPDLDFDFNVVIRSLFYNGGSKYLGYQVGGAITALSSPEGEYEECAVKARAIREILTVPIALPPENDHC